MKNPTFDGERRSVFRVGPVQLDEVRLELTVAGERRAIEAKPMALLRTLLQHAGLIVTKRELIEAAWGNADHSSEASLTTAISKLRAALGEPGRDLVKLVHGSGYSITGPVEVIAARELPGLAFGFQPGLAVPGRPHWILERLLGNSPMRNAWLGRHHQTHETRVFKFADSASLRDTLRREATLSRVLHATLGARSDLVRITGSNFDMRPYFIECGYGGQDLPGWAAAQGGLSVVALDRRLDMLARIARTTAAAHAAGVIHGDIKPANILVYDGNDGPGLRLVDFGAGGLCDAAQLKALGISTAGPRDPVGEASGTFRYLAPEVLAGSPLATGADIYALGILLYQLVVGDLNAPLAAGWEDDIGDELLRQDIAVAAAGDPSRRLNSAAGLAERLETLPARRDALQFAAQAAARAALLSRQVERNRLRQPWIAAAAACLVAGI